MGNGVGADRLQTGSGIGNRKSYAPFGGKTRVFGTNPFVAGIPADGADIIIDFATAGSAEGKLRMM